QHAHEQGVLHRDLKPENVLVDARGAPKVIDFGLARLAAYEESLRLTHDGTTLALGTVAYMSPEQASGHLDALDSGSDVYSLGVMLYELLGDALPHDLEGLSVLEAMRVVAERTPRSLASRDKSLRGDLDAIVANALARERADRYPSVAELATDVRRHL